MAKLAAVLLSLVMFALWGYLSWGEYKMWFLGEEANRERPLAELNYEGFARYVFAIAPRPASPPVEEKAALEAKATPKDKAAPGTKAPTKKAPPKLATASVPGGRGDLPDLPGPNGTRDRPSDGPSEGRVRVGLGAVTALSAAMVYSATVGGGAVFSVGLAAFATFFTLVANLVAALVVFGVVAYGSYVSNGFPYDLAMYGRLLYATVALVAVVSALGRLGEVLRGSAEAMKAVCVWLWALLCVSLPLAPLDLLPGFVAFGLSGFASLAGFCIASLALIGLGHENYRYD